MIHIEFAKNDQKILDEVESRLSSDPPAEPEWKKLCVKLYSAYYNFNEKSNTFIKKYRKVEKKLLSHGETAREFVLVGERLGFMGEDVFVFEGRIQHSLHAKHKICGAYTVASTKNSGVLFCYTCNARFSRAELG